ncbi:MAG: ATP phosphoribosyltransferase [Spirochaetales bacterium]|nr:ATP phosphoribosyltransferase [Spirochaetales bacterium]
MTNEPLLFALPKGRLMEKSQELFNSMGIKFSFDNRKLVADDQTGEFRFFLVKNSDLPTYVHHGIAGLGVCGSDVIYESGKDFYKLHTFSYGSTKMCLAGLKGAHNNGNDAALKVSSKFTRFTRDYYNSKNTPVEIIKLNGSVELGPVLGLSPYIVDLVETGNTLRANNLEVIKELSDIKVHLIANPAYYKINYKRINKFVEDIKKGEENWNREKQK